MNAVSPTLPADLPAQLHAQGWALLSPTDLLPWLHVASAELEPLRATWHQLPPDTHLRDGGHYRFRRHSCFVLDTASGELTQAPHRAHWQPVTYNALHGGFERWFEPIEASVNQHPAWRALLTQLGERFNAAKPVPRWVIEAHPFPVDTAGGGPWPKPGPRIPFETVSGNPPASDTTTGVPDACASSDVKPSASGNTDGTTLTTASR